MTFYTSEIVKPITQICNQQPRDIFDITYTDKNINNNHFFINNQVTTIKKPVAYVAPIEKSNNRDQAVQTDSISIDINSIINIHDYHRSERLVGKLDNKPNETIENYELVSAQNKIKSLENELKQQLKTNEDIKKLLIASLGEDLAAHLGKLTSDVASFNELVTQLVSEKVDCNENIDKLSIEADLWKNKFVAGRVLVDELAGWKHQFSFRYKESLGAIHSLLHERQSLRQLLTMISNELLVLSAHLSHKPPLISLKNTLHLAKYNLSLLRGIKNSLSVGAAWNNQISSNEQYFLDFTDFTEGEELALEVLKNQPNPYADNTARITTSFVSENSQCLEKIADKLCKNCKGDIFVI